MPSINMIAPRRAEKRRLERDMRRLVIAILVELVIAVGLSGWFCTKLLTTHSRIAELDAQIAGLQPIVKQIEQYDAASKELLPKLQLLSRAKDQTMSWYNTLDGLTQSFPQSTYLTRISTTKTDKDAASGPTVTLAGVSISQANIGETMLRLGTIPDFKTVDLHFTQRTAVMGASALEFEVGAPMKGSQKQGKGAQPNGGSQS